MHNVTDELANLVIRINAICAEKDAEIKRLRGALRDIIDLDHHHMRPESKATKIARAVLGGRS